MAHKMTPMSLDATRIQFIFFKIDVSYAIVAVDPSGSRRYIYIRLKMIGFEFSRTDQRDRIC